MYKFTVVRIGGAGEVIYADAGGAEQADFPSVMKLA